MRGARTEGKRAKPRKANKRMFIFLFGVIFFLKTCLTSYTSCHIELINGISEAPLLLQWLSLRSVRPSPATILSVTPSRIPAPSCVYLSISSPRFFFFFNLKKSFAKSNCLPARFKRKLGKFGGRVRFNYRASASNILLPVQ